jgi:hypothetical protein
VSENLPAVISSLLEAYAAVCPRLTHEQHLSFIILLAYTCPATATLRALSSHLSMVAPVVPKRGLQRGQPGGPSQSTGNRSDDVQQEHGSDWDTYEPGSSIREAVVQPISAEFVAQILAIRIHPGSIELQNLLPEHLKARDGLKREMVRPSSIVSDHAC